ncbi:uncharacterized protein BDV14DRAFT_173208 [Aspergillus stella-maris]|uniref:uncharacterized protein n=1 Tax=Aspergillus stella-maris TaxID=1810926 RepID=UPI003CCE3D79
MKEFIYLGWTSRSLIVFSSLIFIPNFIAAYTMATTTTITTSTTSTSVDIRNPSGDWALNKSKSKNLDGALKLQGIGWLRRKAILSGTITLKILQTTEAPPPTETIGAATTLNTDTDPLTTIKTQQGLRGIFAGLEQTRSLNWTEQSQVDSVSGAAVHVKSRFVRGVRDNEGRVKPTGLRIETAGRAKERAEIEAFLGGSVCAPVETGGGEEAREKAFVQDFVRCEEGGWTVEQIWAVESLSDGLFLTCKAVAAKGSTTEQACQVYQLEGQK